MIKQTIKRTGITIYIDPNMRRQFAVKLAEAGEKMSPTLVRWIREFVAGKKS